MALSSSESTWPPTNGVARDVRQIPGYFEVNFPSVVDASARQYEAAVLNQDDTVEYLVWAANSSNIAHLEDPSWGVTSGAVSIPTGSNTVIDTNSPDLQGGSPARTDGSSTIVLMDNDNRSIAEVLSITIIRGDDVTETEVTLFPPADLEVLSPASGLISIRDNATTQALLQPLGSEPPSMSNLRGDRVTQVSYVLASQKFWWTRNDNEKTRFGWDGKTQRWAPFSGGPPKDLGELLATESYTLSPRPTGLELGSFLPGSPDGDAWCLLRVGHEPSSTSYPVAANPAGPFDGALVVTDESAEAEYNFGAHSPEPAAVIGVASGVLQWNPTFIASYSGQHVWYIIDTFSAENNGVVGDLLDAKDSDLYISPVPEWTENPFIRLGSRTPLASTVVADDGSLGSLSVPVGSVGVSSTTGKLKFNAADIDKADPSSVDFDTRYVGAVVIYDGLSLTSVSQPLRAPVALVNASGVPEAVGKTNELYVPDGALLPGLGSSGIFHVPDGTGAIPTTGTPGVRPGGDDLVSPYTGLIRDVSDFGDLVLFTRGAAIETIEVVDLESDFPEFRFEIPQGTAYLARERGPQGSRVELGAVDRTRFEGETLYFLDGHVTLATYSGEGRLISRKRENFQLDGTEVLRFAVNGIVYVWNASSLGAGSYTAEQIAASLDSVIVGPGQAYALRGRIVIEPINPVVGDVEIGFGDSSGDVDLSGSTALGLLPGWRVHGNVPGQDWIPDSGVSLGVYRTPGNLDRSKDTPDFQAYARFENETLQGSLSISPIVPLTNPPLRDIAGYDDDVFFRVEDGAFSRLQRNFEGVVYEFEQDRFVWVDRADESVKVERPLGHIQLENTNVVEESLIEALGGKLQVSEGSGFQDLTFDEDYILPNDGQTGSVVLLNRIGDLKLPGAKGSYSVGGITFTDPDVNFGTAGISEGDRLKIDLTGESYRVAAVNTPTEIEVEPEFYTDGGTSPLAWRIFEGNSVDDYDPSLVADVVYENFNHLPEEPFAVRLYSLVGTVPANETEQQTNRRSAPLAEAIDRGREMAIGFRLDGPEATLVGLLREALGTIANSSLFVPNPGSTRFTDEAFSIRVDTELFTHGTNLVPVPSFSPTIPAGTVEYLTTTGELGFASDLLSSLTLGNVSYVEEFLTPNLLPAGTVEYAPETGELNFSDADMTTYGGDPAYFIEKMITEGSLDVSLNPIAGAFGFRKPLRDGQIVEAQYFQATTSGDVSRDDGGNPIFVREFLSTFVRAEECTRISDQQYSFNPTGRTVSEDIEAVVYIDVYRQNYGNTDTASVDTEASLVNFQEIRVEATQKVTIHYAVYEAFGGETAYQTSVQPVYRPPFFLEAGQNTFQLVTDRTADLYAGVMLRLGANVFYVKSSNYDVASDETGVEVYPAPTLEAGSRAPGHDSLALLTDRPVATQVDGTPVPTASVGFWATITVAYETIRKQQKEILFNAASIPFAVPGHVLEVDGVPTLIVATQVTDDGLGLRVECSVPFEREIDSKTIRVSVRPVYPTGAAALLGLGPLIPPEGFELVLFGLLDDSGNPLPGRTLALGIDYELNADTGTISLISPELGGLQSGQELYLSFTQLRTLTPFLNQGVLVNPKYAASYAHWVSPSEENGLLGLTLKGTYTFDNPDSFYFRAVRLEDYADEVASEINEDTSSQSTSGGPITVTVQDPENYEVGNLGVESQLSDAQDHDRAARWYVEIYHGLVTNLEQVVETGTGTMVGLRDGKLRLFVGRGRIPTPPGYEDPVSGKLNRRNLWSQVYLSETASSGPIRFQEEDLLVEPDTATLSGAELSGTFMSSRTLERMRAAQSVVSLNEVDDRVLVGRDRIRLIRSGLIRVPQAEGLYDPLGVPSRLSRVYPELMTAYTTTVPGLNADVDTGDPGVYAYSRALPDGDTGSTAGEPIAILSNPVLGILEGLSDALVQKRRARAWIWGYSPTGYPSLDGASAGRPSVIASVVPLDEFPVDPSTNLPDLTQLATQGGAVDDLNVGMPDLHVPPFQSHLGSEPPAEAQADQISLGRPSSAVLGIGNRAETVTIGSESRLAGVFVHEILQGCIITFRSDSASGISNAADIVVMTSPTGGDPWEPLNGDTLLVVPSTGSTTTISDPPTQEEVAMLAKAMPFYREGVDYGVNRQTGELVDITQPSFADPSLLGIKEILGQNPPDPMSTLEARVGKVSSVTSPVEIPALLSQALNDSGDLSVPFVYVDSERDALREVMDGGVSQLFADTIVPDAQYPDEFHGADGEVLPSLGGSDEPPAALITSLNLLPITFGGPYVPHSGIGDLDEMDLLLIEVDDGQFQIPRGGQGILEVGSVAYDNSVGKSYVETPRFVTSTRKTDRVRYRFDNLVGYLPGPGKPGMIIQEVGPFTEFDITAVGFPEFDDGNNVSSGGLNWIMNSPSLPFPNENRIEIRFFDKASGNVVELVRLTGDPTGAGLGLAIGGLGSVNFPAAPTISSFRIRVLAIGFVDFATLGAPPGGPTAPLDYTLTVDTSTSGGSGGTAFVGSYLADVRQDRLTFRDALDFRAVLERGSLSGSGFPVAGRLAVTTVTGPYTEDLQVNDPGSVNGGTSFTFLSRDIDPVGSHNGGIGSFRRATTPGDMSEIGTVKVNGFEGHGNTPVLNTSPVTFSGVPSTRSDATGDICTGVGVCESNLTYNYRVSDIQVVTGTVSAVEPGDVLVITGASDGSAPVNPGATGSTKVGAYLVRQVVESDNPGTQPEKREVTLAATTGVSGGWLEVQFPTVVSINTGAGTTTVSDIYEYTNPTLSSPSGHVFPSTGRIYAVVNLGTLGSATLSEYRYAVLSASYTSVNTTTNTFEGVGDYRDCVGDPITAGLWVSLVRPGVQISGMVYLPVWVGGEQGLPDYNVVGWDDVNHPHGLRHLSIENTVAPPLVLSGPADIKDFGTATSGTVEVEHRTVYNPYSFLDELWWPVYWNVTGFLSTEYMTPAQWDSVHNPNGFAITANEGANCVLPGENFTTTDGANPGYYAQSGIFLEPSWPRPVVDLGSAQAHVVDAGHSLPLAEVGFRDYSSFAPPLGFPEPVTFEVRRIRRFHSPMETLTASLQRLKLLYEKRRGTITGYSTTTAQFGVITAAGTSLGPFDDPKVGIRPGDLFAVLDAQGTVIERVPIEGVQSGSELLLAVPGITEVTNPTVNLPGMSFEIALRQAPVPHEQSYENLLDLATEEEVWSSEADFGTDEGGYVQNTGNYSSDVNVLRDTRVPGTGSDTFPAKGVQEGDIVIVDLTGTLPGTTPVEVSTRPLGDRSVSTRGGPYVAGTPSQLDDNRGFYRVVEVNDDSLTVDGTTEFAGVLGSDVVFEDGTGYDFALYPTVHASGLTAGQEGQVDLRPTAYEGQSGSPPDSFLGNFLSTAPFSYQVIRPRSLLSQEAVDLILSSRERFLSWFDFLNRYFLEQEAGSYFIFQRDEHMQALGSPGVPGLGPITNEQVESLVGLINVAPYANSSSSLSCLGFRFWILDERLDDTEPPYAGGPPTYTDLRGGVGRPVLPDRIESVMGKQERLRQIRYAWLDYRLNRIDGSFTTTQRLEADIDSLVEEQAQMIRLADSTED
jgi:hypothetical protein